MSATATFTSQAIAEWVKIFPRQVTETYTSSVTFMKQLTVVAISTITYLKNVFPEDNYTIETFGGVRLRILKKKCRDELAQFVSTALSQAFEAFDKKYLHQLVICFYDGECKVENLMEYFIFEYSYTPEGVTMDVHSKSQDNSRRSSRYSFDNVRERTLHMIRACVVIMEACHEMPDSYDVSLRLYYNDDAPEGYQAPGFLPSQEQCDQLEGTSRDTVKLGWVHTPYHRLTARTYIRPSVSASHEAIPSQNAPMMSQMEQDDFDGSSVQKSVSDSTETRIQCPCNRFDYDDTHAVLTCMYCNTQQHAACFGVLRDKAARVTQHCCTTCSDADPARKPTDDKLATLGDKKRECLCIFRRTLEWCLCSAHVVGDELMHKFGMSALNAVKLIKLLTSHGIVPQGTDSDLVSARPILSDQLKSVMSKFFQPEEPDLVEQLIADSLSQNSHTDPVGDVLSPMEKVSLQNATTLGKIVEPEQPQVVQDELLKEYRDAIMTNVEKENDPPLCGNHNPVDVQDIGKKSGKRKMTTKTTGVKTKRARANRY